MLTSTQPSASGVTVYQTVWLLALAYAALFLPLAVGVVGAAVAEAPSSLDEVARSLGRRPSFVLRTITLPLAAPGLAAGAALRTLVLALHALGVAGSFQPADPAARRDLAGTLGLAPGWEPLGLLTT